MFIYADLSKTGHDHFLFNTGYFTVLQHIQKGAVALYCHPSHFNYIKEELDLKDVSYKEVYIPVRKSGLLFPLRWIYKNIYDFWVLRNVLKHARKQEAAFVFFAMMPVRSMYYLRFWHKFFYPGQQVILTFHGEIETWFETKKNATQRFHAFIFKQLFAYSNPNLKFFVPNGFIRENLRAEPLFRNKDILSIYHLLHPEKGTLDTREQTIVLGHIGSTEQRKNSRCFFELARRVSAPEKPVIFKVAGRYNPVFDAVCKPGTVVFSDQSKILERKYFDQEILSVHFSVLFIYPHEYLYRESGTVLESLKFYKPVIGLRHAYFDFLEREYGQIGLYADTVEALAGLVDELLSDRQRLADLYGLMVQNIAGMHAKITLEHLSADMKTQMVTTDILPD